jgi:hypothetical protein
MSAGAGEVPSDAPSQQFNSLPLNPRDETSLPLVNFKTRSKRFRVLRSIPWFSKGALLGDDLGIIWTFDFCV